MLEVIDLDYFRKHGACIDPGEFAPEDWRGNILDILRALQVPIQYKFWCFYQTDLFDYDIAYEVAVKTGFMAPDEEILYRLICALERKHIQAI